MALKTKGVKAPKIARAPAICESSWPSETTRAFAKILEATERYFNLLAKLPAELIRSSAIRSRANFCCFVLAREVF